MVYRLSDLQKKQCTKYVYRENNCSVHEKLMKPVWTKVESFIPQCVCATTITTVGLLANLIPCIVLMIHAPAAQETVPSWLLVWCCLGMFMHQNLDNMDGRHARRFGVENTITDFFDHTADAITAGITVVNVSIATKLGNFPDWMVVFAVVFLVVFYSYHWQVYNSALVKFGVFDVTETQDVAMVTVLVSAIAGQDVWNKSINVLEGQPIDARKICLILACIGGILKVIQNLVSVCQCAFDRSRKVIHKRFDGIFPGIPIACNVLCIYIACRGNPDIYLKYPVLLLATMTIMIGKPIVEIMVIHFVHSTMAILTLNEVAMAMFSVNAFTSIIETKTSLVILLVVGCMDICVYFYRIAADMHDCMGFKWFKLTLHSVDNTPREMKTTRDQKDKKTVKIKKTNIKYLFQL